MIIRFDAAAMLPGGKFSTKGSLRHITEQCSAILDVKLRRYPAYHQINSSRRLRQRATQGLKTKPPTLNHSSL